MKPAIQFNQKSRRDSENYESRQGFSLPTTDYSFQAGSLADGGRCFGACRTSFRAISQDYFKTEAPRSFVGEAAFFSVIVLTAALPIISTVSALVHLARSLGAL